MHKNIPNEEATRRTFVLPPNLLEKLGLAAGTQESPKQQVNNIKPMNSPGPSQFKQEITANNSTNYENNGSIENTEEIKCDKLESINVSQNSHSSIQAKEKSSKKFTKPGAVKINASKSKVSKNNSLNNTPKLEKSKVEKETPKPLVRNKRSISKSSKVKVNHVEEKAGPTSNKNSSKSKLDDLHTSSTSNQLLANDILTDISQIGNEYDSKQTNSLCGTEESTSDLNFNSENTDKSNTNNLSQEPTTSTPVQKRKNSKKSNNVDINIEQLSSPTLKRTPKANKAYLDFDTSINNRKRKISEESVNPEKRLKASEKSLNISVDNVSTQNIDKTFLEIYVDLKMNPSAAESCEAITCAICNESIHKPNWDIHKLKHNNLINMKKYKPANSTGGSMNDILNDILQKTGVLICEKCCYSEKEVPKFMTHMKQCKNQSKNCCEICGRKIKKPNKISHMELHNSIHLDSLQPAQVEVADSPMGEYVDLEADFKLVCAICNQDVMKSKWNEHKLKHNNLAWCVGGKAINLSQTNVKKILDKFLKENKHLVCFDCGTLMTRVSNYTKHIKECQKIQCNQNDTLAADSKITEEEKASEEDTVSDEENITLMELKGKTEKLDVSQTQNESKQQNEEIYHKNNNETKTDEVNASLNLNNETNERTQLVEELDETVTKVTSSTKDVTCARCNESMPKSKWPFHKAKHNNLAWNNLEPPLDIDDRKVCERILQSLIKKKKKLKCDICKTVKKSAVGFLAHIDRCNKTEEEINNLRVACTICQRLYFPTSMSVHLNQAHPAKPAEKTESSLILDESTDGSGRTKRKAAEKALSIIDDLKKGISESHTKTVSDMYTKPSQIRLPNPVLICWKKEMSTSEDGTANCRNISCTFRSSKLDELKAHHMICELSPRRGFWCTACPFRCNEESVIQNHIKESHQAEMEKPQVTKIESDVDDDFDIDDECESEESDEELAGNWDIRVKNAEENLSYLKRNRGVNKFAFILMEKYICSSLPVCYAVAHKWTIKYREKNYSKVPLFENWCNLKMNLIPSALHMTFFGANESVQMACINGVYKSKQKAEEINWKTYQLFESVCDDNGIVTIFCGGPIWGLAWCPFNNMNDPPEEQFLAVSSHRHWEDCYEMDTSFNGKDKKGNIQIWNMGVLNNKIGKCTTTPKLLYMIAHNFGAIWKLEWCPSGGSIEHIDNSEFPKIKRLGLLAAACSDGNIYIFSVCIPQQSDLKTAPLYNQKPAVVLKLNHSSRKKKYHATSLCWSKESGHKTFAAGFSNGFVGVWDLGTESKLLKHEENGVVCLHPHHIFKAHQCNVTALCIFPNLGSNYLFTGSSDRTIQFWQLNSASGSVTAVPLNGNQFKSNRITASAWNSHWITTLVALDDVCGYGRANSTFLAIRDLTYKPTIILNSNSVIWDISCCDWSNGFSHVTEGGEISATYPHQLMAYVDSSKSIRNKRMIIGYSRIHKLHDSQTEADSDVESNLKPENSINLEITDRDLNSPVSWSENLSDNEDATSKASSIVSSPDKSNNIVWENKYKDIVKNHGVVFYDLPTETKERAYDTSNLQSSAAPQYPLNSLTRVAYNPNYHSHSYLAIGMQAGFVRVRCISGMRTIKT